MESTRDRVDFLLSTTCTKGSVITERPGSWFIDIFAAALFVASA